jgi:hypothetical protein
MVQAVIFVVQRGISLVQAVYFMVHGGTGMGLT